MQITIVIKIPSKHSSCPPNDVDLFSCGLNTQTYLYVTHRIVPQVRPLLSASFFVINIIILQLQIVFSVSFLLVKNYRVYGCSSTIPERNTELRQIFILFLSKKKYCS